MTYVKNRFDAKILILGAISFAFLFVYLVQSSQPAQAATQGSLMGYWKLDQTTAGSTAKGSPVGSLLFISCLLIASAIVLLLFTRHSSTRGDNA